MSGAHARRLRDRLMQRPGRIGWILVCAVAFVTSGGGPAALDGVPRDAIETDRIVLPDGSSVRYTLVRPESARRSGPVAGRDETAFPLVVVLADPDRSAGSGVYSFGRLAGPAVRSRYPAYLLAAPADTSLSALSGLVDHIVAPSGAGHPIDSGRVFLVAESEGADRAWRLLAERPDRFAAFVSIGGDPGAADPQALDATAIWVFHGELDDRVPVERARAVASAFWAESSAELRYTELRNVGNASWVAAWRERRLLPWLFSQSRE
jgi:hypothetical protein